jgi:cell fate regulator YaaT (PSP1 superfamily)
MCCLKYEEDAYSHLASITPRVGSTVKTPQGIGTVTDVNLVTGNLYVKLLDSDALPFKIHRDNVSRASNPRKANKFQNNE